MAQAYVSKADFERTLERVEGHLVRMEDKLDKIADRAQNIRSNWDLYMDS